MVIETKYAGTQDINEERILHFPQGIPSFEEEKQFILMPFSEEPSPFYILQSIETAGFALVVMTPFDFFPEYEAKLSDQVLEDLTITSPEEVTVLAVLTLRKTLETSTVNLRGPIILNQRTQQGKQIVLTDSDYETRHPLKRDQQKTADGHGMKGEK